jgi:hypothetical protein
MMALLRRATLRAMREQMNKTDEFPKKIKKKKSDSSEMTEQKTTPLQRKQEKPHAALQKSSIPPRPAEGVNSTR